MKKQLLGKMEIKDYELASIIMEKLSVEYDVEYYENMVNGFVESTEIRVFKIDG